MTRPRPRIRIREDGDRLLISGWRAGDLLDAGGFHGYYVGTVRAFTLDARHLADLAAWLDYRNVPFDVLPRGDGAA